VSRTQIILYTLLLNILLFSSGGWDLSAQSPINVEIKTVSNVDVCGNKQFQIYIQTDEIYASDSIVGFDLFIGFNPEKIQLDQLLSGNTISGQLQSAGTDASLTINKLVTGEVWISGAFLVDRRFLKGKQPLLALSGRYLKNCSDTTSITVLQYTPAYYDFRTAPEIITKDLVLKAEVTESGRRLSTYVVEDSLIFKVQDSLKGLQVYLSNDDILQTKELEWIAKIENPEAIDIVEVESVQPNVRIDTVLLQDSQKVIQLSLLGQVEVTKPSLELKIKRKSIDSAVIKINLSITPKSECTCITKVLNDSLVIKVLPQPVSIDEMPTLLNEVKIESSFSNGKFVLYSPNAVFQRVEVYNVLGQKTNMFVESQNNVVIPENKLNIGLNIMELTVIHENRIKKMLIKYIK